MKFTKEEKDLFRKLGRRGGKNRSASMTENRRRDIAQKAANARWARAKEDATVPETEPKTADSAA